MISKSEHQKMGLGYLLELATGHYRAKVLFVATNLGIFTILSKSQKKLEELSGELNIEIRPAKMILNACVSLKLLHKKNDLYSNTRTAEIYLVKDKLQYMEPAFFKFDDHSYLLFDKLKDAILSNSEQISKGSLENSELSPSCMLIGNKDDYRKFLSALDPIAQWPANVIATTFKFSAFNKLIDIGGGSGVYSIAIVNKNPGIKAVVFDLSHVCDIGRKRITEIGLNSKVEYHAGDYFEDPLSEDVDVALISNVLHGYGPEKCHDLLKKVYKHLPSGGAVIINDTILDDDGCGPEIANLLSFYYLLITEDGRNYTVCEYKDMLKESGFVDIKLSIKSGGTRYITGVKR